MDTKLWEAFGLEDDKYYSWQAGNLRLYFIKKKDEFSLASEYCKEDVFSVQESKKVPQDIEWKRWIIKEQSSKITFLPVMPDRPLVVKTEAPLNLLPKCSERFYISIPVWIKVQLDKDQDIVQLPSTILSNSWFGDPLGGTLAYAVKSTASTSISSGRKKINTAICPLMVNNQSPDQFDFIRICLYTDYLGVFQGEKHLWTNSVEVNIEGQQQTTRLDISASQPKYEGKSKVLTKPRQTPSKGLSKKIFSDFKFFKF